MHAAPYLIVVSVIAGPLLVTAFYIVAFLPMEPTCVFFCSAYSTTRGANQSWNHQTRLKSEDAFQQRMGKESARGDLREVDLISKAERKYRALLLNMRDAYGDDDGYEMFKLVILSPAKYQQDNRRLIRTLAQEAISNLEGFGSSASTASKLGILKSGLSFIYDALDGQRWRDQRPGWSPADRQLSVVGWNGVTIERGLLTGLKLMHNNLSGDIHTVLEKLGELRRTATRTKSHCVESVIQRRPDRLPRSHFFVLRRSFGESGGYLCSPGAQSSIKCLVGISISRGHLELFLHGRLLRSV